MGTFTIDGNYDTLFAGSDFMGRVELSVTRDELNNTFTVAVTGAKAWSKYGLNTNIDFSCWLADNSSGSGKQSGGCTIPKSGNTSHTGWNPSTGYTSVTNCTKEFNANTVTGACPTVYLSFKFDTGSVHYLDKDTYVSAQSTYASNISARVQEEAGGANDRSLPYFMPEYPKVRPLTATTASFSVKVNTNNSGVEYTTTVENTTNNEGVIKYDTKDQTEVSGIIKTDSSNNKINIICTKENNGMQCVRADIDVDCSKPDIEFVITPTGLNTATGRIKSERYDFKYEVDGGPFTSTITPKGEYAEYRFLNEPNTTHSHTAKTRREDVDIDSEEAVYSVDMRLPQIEDFNLIAITSQSGLLKFRCNLPGVAYWYDSQNKVLGTWEITKLNTLEEYSVNLNHNTSETYRLKVVRNDYNVLYSQKSVTCNTMINTAQIVSVTKNSPSLSVNVKIEGGVKGTPTARLYNIQHNLVVPNNNASPVPGYNLGGGNYKFDFNNVPINYEMGLRINVTSSDSGLTTVTELNNSELICNGVVYVYTGDDVGQRWKKGIVYVNVDGTKDGWKGGAPYINTDGTSQGWAFGKLNG